jgi:hypothetical protein
MLSCSVELALFDDSEEASDGDDAVSASTAKTLTMNGHRSDSDRNAMIVS